MARRSAQTLHPNEVTLPPEAVERVADRIRELAEEARTGHTDIPVRHVLEAIQESEGHEPRWLTSTEAAVELGVSRNTVKKWARIGSLRGARRDLEGWWRIPVAAVQRVVRIENDLAAVP